MSFNSDTTTLEQGAPETIKLVADILLREMKLRPAQINIYNQKRELPTDDTLMLDVAILGRTLFSVRREYVSDGVNPELREVQSANAMEVIQIDLFGYGDEPRLRQMDVPFALSSSYAEEIAETYGLRIGRVPANFVDASEAEGSRRLTRFVTTFNVQRGYSRIKAAPTYTEFEIPPMIVANP